MKIFSELLKKTLDFHRDELNSYDLSHGPTIGAMYEGLTREKFFGSLNLEMLGLKVVSGFITAAGKTSRQMDCMLVCGEGAKVPYTELYKWPASQVLAVVEVKKNLFFQDLKDSYSQLQSAWDFHCKDLEYRESVGALEFSTKRAAKEYISIFGELPPHYNEAHVLPIEKRMVYRSLVKEELAPLRVVIGYNGYKSEGYLREAVNSFYDNKAGVAGHGTVNMPSLIISNHYSVLKINGLPYKSFWDLEHGWVWLGSSHDNPILLMLELLIDKVERYLEITIDRGEDLNEEIWYPLMCAKPDRSGRGWYFTYAHGLPKEYNAEGPGVNGAASIDDRGWSPIELTDIEREIALQIYRSPHCELDGPELYRVLQKFGESDVMLHTERLIRLRIVIFDEGMLIICPGKISLIDVLGKTYCGDDGGDRLKKWAAVKTAPPIKLNSPLNISLFPL